MYPSKLLKFLNPLKYLKHIEHLFNACLKNGVLALGFSLGIALVLSTTAHAGSKPSTAPFNAIDDTGQRISLKKPAQRVISLAPHATELLYAAGGESALIAAVAYSDYPAKALALPRVGDYRAFDIERIVALKPDLIVAWPTSGSRRALATLHKLQLPVFYSDPHTLDDIALTLEKLGALLGTSTIAQTAAKQFKTDIEALRLRYATRTPVRVFYQVSDRPLITLNGKTLVNELLKSCGGVNVFAEQHTLAPVVSTEAMLATKPDVIIISQPNLGKEQATKTPMPYAASALPQRLQTKTKPSARSNNAYAPVFKLQSDLLDRPGPRLALGTKQLCEVLDFVRHAQLEAKSAQQSAPHATE